MFPLIKHQTQIGVQSLSLVSAMASDTTHAMLTGGSPPNGM